LGVRLTTGYIANLDIGTLAEKKNQKQ